LINKIFAHILSLVIKHKKTGQKTSSGQILNSAIPVQKWTIFYFVLKANLKEQKIPIFECVKENMGEESPLR